MLRLQNLGRRLMGPHLRFTSRHSFVADATKFLKLPENTSKSLVEPSKLHRNVSPIVSKDLTAAELNLVKHLKTEIGQQRHAQQLEFSPPFIVDDFVASFNGSTVKLDREIADNESVQIHFDVSKSICRSPKEEEYPISLLRCTPKFEVLIRKNNVYLSVMCTFKTSAFDNLGVDFKDDTDVYTVENLSIFSERTKDNCFTIDSTILDDQLQMLISDLLKEKGVTSKLAKKMSDLTTAREHSLYIEFLEKLALFNMNITSIS